MKIFLSLLLSLFLAIVFSQGVEAKVLPQAQKNKTAAITKNATSATIGVTPKLRVDRKALTIYFSNLQNASQVSYMLRYKTNGQEEGAMGALNLTGSQSQTTELLFGTCSKNICRYHTNISDARLEVSYTSKSGKKYLKRYKIRV